MNSSRFPGKPLKKINGVPLYKFARKGIYLNLKGQMVKIYKISLISYNIKKLFEYSSLLWMLILGVVLREHEYSVSIFFHTRSTFMDQEL